MRNTNLQSIISYTSDSRELQTYFYQLSSDMKKLHSKGIYITDFKPSHIHYNDGGFSFLAESMEENINREFILSNIYECAILMIKTFASKAGFESLNPGINKDSISNVLSELQHAFTDEDNSYFKQLFENNNISYYHDYINRYNQLLGEGKDNHKNLVKATSIGSKLIDEEPLNKAAFVSVPAVFVMAGMLIIIMILIYALFILKY